MLEKVTTYLGRLFRLAKPIASAARTTVVAVPVPESKPKRIVEQKYTSRKTTRLKPAVDQVIIKKNSRKMSSSDSMPKTTSDNIIWMDLEMTGLDINQDVIMEIGCIITGPNLNELARHPEIIIHVPGKVLDSMSSWCLSTHGASGLTEACRLSTATVAQADAQLVEFMRQYTEAGLCPLGGNSNFMDRVFMNKYMPGIASHLHYRSVDVSTIKELVRRWYPKEYAEMPAKRFIHKTVADLEDSIAELKYYRSVIFKPSESEEQNESKVENKQQ